ncbi:MAG: hypothetical protein IAE85_16170 [Anaerolinea sp.]|nr:hypothetical protein [Anaerolinea sp.]
MRSLDHKVAKVREAHEARKPRSDKRPVSRSSSFAIFAHLRGFVIQTLATTLNHFQTHPFQTHPIQFRLAAWTGSGDNGTRWLYLDDLGIIP